MSTVTIRQRTRENQIVKTYTATPVISTGAAGFNSLTWDGHSMWCCSNGDLVSSGLMMQVDLETNSNIYEFNVTGLANKHNIYDIVFNGEQIRCIEGLSPAADKSFLLDRIPGPVTMPLTSPATTINGSSLGLTFDGESYWISRITTFIAAQTTFEQWSPDGAGLLILTKSFTLPQEVGGLTFDGEFLVCHPKITVGVSNFDLFYIDRDGNIEKNNAGEVTTLAHRDGLTFDGEFIYSLEFS